MVKFLPAELRGLIAQIPGDLITEIRLREGERTVVFERREKGAARKELGYVPTKEEIERIVMRLCESRGRYVETGVRYLSRRGKSGDLRQCDGRK